MRALATTGVMLRVREALLGALMIVLLIVIGWGASHGHDKLEIELVAGIGALALGIWHRGVFIGVFGLVAMDGVPFFDSTTPLASHVDGLDLGCIGLIAAATAWILANRGANSASRIGRALSWCGVALFAWFMFRVLGAYSSGVPLLAAIRFGRDFFYFAALLIVLPRVRLSAREIGGVLAVLTVGVCLFALGQIAIVLGLAHPTWLVHATDTGQTLGLTRVYSPMNETLMAGLAGGIAAVALARRGSNAQMIAVPLTLLLIVSFVVQLTRARWITLIAAIVVVSVWFAFRADRRLAVTLRRRLAISIAFLAGAVVLLTLIAPGVLSTGPIAQRIASIFTDIGATKGDVAYRQEVSKLMLSMLGSHWPSGIGLIPPSAHFFFALPFGSIRDPDLGVLNAVMTIGVIGAALIYLPVVIMLGYCLRAARSLAGSRYAWIVYGGLIWMLATLASSITLVTLFSVGGLVLTALVLMLLSQPDVLGVDVAQPMEASVAVETTQGSRHVSFPRSRPAPVPARLGGRRPVRSRPGWAAPSAVLGVPQEVLSQPVEMIQATLSAEPATAPAESGARWWARGMLASATGTAALQVVSNGLGFAVSVILARGLGRSGYGIYALSIAWAGFLAIPGIVGFDRFLVRGLAVYELRSQWALMKGLLRRTNEIVLGASLLLAAIAGIVAATQVSSSMRVPFMIAMLLVPLTNLTLIRQAAMQALRKVVVGQTPEYLIRPILITLGIGTLYLVAHHNGLSATSAVVVNVGAVGFAFVVGALWLRRSLPSEVRATRPSFMTTQWLNAAVPMMFVGGIWTANNYCATLIVGAIQGPRAAGVYNVVDKGAALTALVLVAANLPLAPALARIHATRDRVALERTTMRMARVALLASIPLAVALAAFPDVYLGIFGHGFESGATALRILALGQLVNSAAGPAGNVLMMTGNERSAVVGVGVGLLANFLLGLVLVPELGVTGAAIGSTASLILWNATLVWLARRHVGINASATGRPVAHKIFRSR